MEVILEQKVLLVLQVKKVIKGQQEQKVLKVIKVFKVLVVEVVLNPEDAAKVSRLAGLKVIARFDP